MGIGQDSLQATVPLLDERVRSLSWSPSSRVQLAMTCFVIALDHQAAIAALFRQGHFGSAYVLIRPLLEATVKGAWLAHCATEAALARHARGVELPSVAILLEKLRDSTLPDYLHEFLIDLKSNTWSHMSSLTHAGFAQVQRWVSINGVAPNFPEQEREEIANICSLVGVVACIEAARLCGSVAMAQELEARFPR